MILFKSLFLVSLKKSKDLATNSCIAVTSAEFGLALPCMAVCSSVGHSTMPSLLHLFVLFLGFYKHLSQQFLVDHSFSTLLKLKCLPYSLRCIDLFLDSVVSHFYTNFCSFTVNFGTFWGILLNFFLGYIFSTFVLYEQCQLKNRSC